MKYIGSVSGLVAVSMFVFGCMSVPNSPTPRFYALQAVDENQMSKNLQIDPEMLIGMGPVKVPEYQDRPHIVTQDKENMLKFSQFDRWGEPLNLGVARLIREYLNVMFPGAKIISHPWDSAIAVNYQVIVEIVQLDSEIDKDLFLAAQWLIIDTQNSETIIIKRSEFRQAITPQNYSGLAKTLSMVCASLSGEIAEALAGLETRPQTKEPVPPLNE